MRFWTLLALTALPTAGLAQTTPTATPVLPTGPSAQGDIVGHHLPERPVAGAGCPPARSARRPHAAGIPRRLGADPVGDGDVGRAGHRHRRAEFRFRPAFPRQADGEGGRIGRHHRPHQPGDGCRDARAGEGARGQWRHRAADRQPHRGAARRRAAGARGVRQGAGKSARPADPVGHAAGGARRAGADDAFLSHPRARLDQRLCHAVRRGEGRDRRAGLGYADQQHRHDL